MCLCKYEWATERLYRKLELHRLNASHSVSQSSDAQPPCSTEQTAHHYHGFFNRYTSLCMFVLAAYIKEKFCARYILEWVIQLSMYH